MVWPGPRYLTSEIEPKRTCPVTRLTRSYSRVSRAMNIRGRARSERGVNLNGRTVLPAAPSSVITSRRGEEHMNHYYVLYEKTPHDGANWLTVVSGLKTMRSPSETSPPGRRTKLLSWTRSRIRSSLEPTLVAKRANASQCLEETAATGDKLPSGPTS
jgi:hypothetical protein